MGLRHGSAGPDDDTPPGHARSTTPTSLDYACGLRRPVSGRADRLYYQNIFDKTIKQKAVFGEVTYDLTEKWSVTGGARWFEYDRHEVDESYVPQGVPAWDPHADIDPDDRRVYRRARRRSHRKLRHGQRHRLQVRDAVQVRRRPDGVSRSTARGSAWAATTRARGRNGRRSRSSTSRTSSRTTRSASRAPGSTIGCSSTSRRSSWSGRTSSSTRRSGRRDTVLGARHLQWRQDAEQKGVEINRDLERHAELRARRQRHSSADPEFTEETLLPERRSRGPTTMIVIRARHVTAALAGAEVLGVGRNTRSPTSWAWNGDLWTRCVATATSRTPGRISTRPIDRDPDADTSRPGRRATLQFGFSHDNGWEAALIVRNLFDEKGINWLSASRSAATTASAIRASATSGRCSSHARSACPSPRNGDGRGHGLRSVPARSPRASTP